MANTIRIKRRVASVGGAVGTPSVLNTGELAYNENDSKLYYGFGDDGSGVATSISTIGGTGFLPTGGATGDYVDRTTDQTIAGVKTFNSTISGVGASLGNVACNTFAVNTDKFTIANTGNTDIEGTLGVTGVTTLAALVNADGGISTTSGNLVLDSTGGTIDINDNVDISGTLVVGSTLNTHTIPGGTGTFALTSDTLTTHSGHSYIDISGQDIVAGDVELGSHTSGTYVSSLTADSAATPVAVGGSGISVVKSGTTHEIQVDDSVVKTTGAQTISGVKTFNSTISGVGASLGNVACNTFAVATDKFTIANTGNTVIEGTLGIGTTPNAAYELDVDGTIHASTEIYTTGNLSAAANVEVQGSATIGTTAAATSAHQGFLVRGNAAGLVKVRASADVLSDIGAAPAAGSTSITTLGTIGTGTWAATDVAVLHGGTGASTAALAATNLGLGTTNNVTFANITTTADIEVGTSLDVIGDAEVQGTTTLTTAEATVDTNKFLVSDGGVVKYRTGADVRSDIGVDTLLDLKANIANPTFTGDGVTITGTGTGTSSVGYLRGPTTFTIDPSGHADNTGTVVIAGNLQVDGTTTTINSTVVEIDDLATKVAADTTTSAALTGAGLLLGTDPNSPPALSSGALVEFIYANTGTRMELSSPMKITGGLEDTVIDGGTF